MSKHAERLVTIGGLLGDEYSEGYVQGLCEGRAAAERIMVNFLVNDKLIEPKSLETLEEWARKELLVLLGKMKGESE